MAAATEYTTPITAPSHGVMTVEVGAVTGALELRTTSAGDGRVRASVRYAGAEEWYEVRGGTCELTEDADHAAVHALLVGVLDWPGKVSSG